MHSNRSEHGHSRLYNERSSRQWDNYEDRREWLEPHRDVHCDSQSKNGVNGHSSTWTTSGSRGYSDSPKRLDSKDSLNRERSRKSPMRRRMSSPDRATSDHKRRRFTESDEEDYRSRRILEGKASRQSPNTMSHSHNYKDLKPTLPQEDDFMYIKETHESRRGYRHKESTHCKQYGVLTCRQSSGYCKDRDGHDRNWDHSFGRTRPQDHSMKYCESDQQHKNVADPEQKRSTKGFQRFLDVLNKGVNISMLNMIMTQTSTNEDDQSQSPTSFMNTRDHSWSPGCTAGQQGSHQTTSHWSESKGSPRRASPQPEQRSFSPKKCSLSDEKSLQRGDGAKACSSSNSRSRSPSEVEKTTLKPEYKHKHMQDVLQAIGMNLGFEELGQMSHRIQERLYGKRDGDGDRQSRESKEKDTMQASSQIPQGGSSSERSSFSLTTQEYYTKNESHSGQMEETGVHQTQVDQTIEYDQNNSGILHKGEKFEMESQQNTAYHSFSQNPSCTLSKPFPPPLTQMFPPVNCSPLPYTAPPPTLPHGGPQLLLPCMPPLFNYPHLPPLNVFPSMLGQTRHLVPQHHVNPQPVFNLPIQKPKTLSRPRCLQVIETKQTG